MFKFFKALVDRLTHAEIRRERDAAMRVVNEVKRLERGDRGVSVQSVIRAAQWV